MKTEPITIPPRDITREQAISELQSVFDQIIATGGIKSLQQATNLISLFNTVSEYVLLPVP